MTKRRMSIGLFLSFLVVATAAIWLTVPAGNAAPAGADVSIGSISCAPGVLVPESVGAATFLR